MLTEIHIAGVYTAPIAVYAVAALFLTLAIRFLLWWTGLLDLFWHRALVEVALYAIVLCLMVMYV